MDLRHTRTFVTVAELGTVSKAALHLHTAQPALSRQISDLEAELGINLFDRVGRRLVLTSEGEQLLPDCHALLACAAAIQERARQLQRGDTGMLKVAASPQIIEGAMSDFLMRYAQRYPKVQVKLTEAIGWTDVAGMLQRGELHLALNLLGAVSADDPHFGSRPLEAIDLLAATRSGSPLGDSGKIEIVQLAKHRLLLLDASYVFRRHFDAACRLAGVKPSVIYESRTPHTLLAMAESGHGVAVIPSGMRTDRHQLRITAITYRGKPLRERLTIYWDRRRPMPRYAAEFCEMLSSYLHEVFPISSPRSGTRRGAAVRRVS